MATRKSSSKPAPTAGQPPAAAQDAGLAALTNLGLDVVGIRGTLEDAIGALMRIHRLADLTRGELDGSNLDGVIFTDHISELCARHGRRLDAIYERLNPGVRVGVFDHDCYSEAANG
jgi:hypothetical protein